ncbi:MAG: DUF4340 domain-containing protein [Oscillospiraceae bacterium]
MNGKIKSLIVSGVFILALGIMLVVLKLNGLDTTDTDSSSTSAAVTTADTSVSIISTDSANIKQITVKNTNADYTLVQSGTDSSTGDPTFSLKELKDVNQSDTLTGAMANIASTLKATNIAEKDAQDLSKYGFDKPRSTFTVTFGDSTPARTFLIGNDSPVNNTVYLNEQGSKTVYIASAASLSYFTDTLASFAALALVEAPANDAYPTYVKETIVRKDLDYPVIFEQDPTPSSTDADDPSMVSAQVMTSPIFAYLNVTNSTPVTHGIWGLNATSCAAVFPTDKDFAKYGLADPQTKVTLVSGGADYVLKIGNPVYAKDDNGDDTTTVESYYCWIDAKGCDAIYTVAADDLPWVTFQPSDVITSLMTYNYIYNIKNIVIEDLTASATSTLNFHADKPALTITPDLDGTAVTSDLTKQFYQFLMGSPTTEIYSTEPKNACVYRISINLTAGGGDVLEFYPDTERRTIIKLNGKTSFRIPTTYLTALKANLVNLAQGKEMETTY